MKLFIVFTLAVVAVSAGITPEQRQRANEHVTACVKETGATPESAQKLSAGDFSQNDEKTQCFAKCFMEKAGFLNAQGHLDEDVIVAKLGKGADEAKVKALVARCKNETGKSACETAYKVYQCYYANKAL